MKTLLAATALLIVLPTGGRAEPNQYLCVVEATGGLHYDSQTNVWLPQAFRPGKKYVLRRLTNDDRDKTKGKWWSTLEYHPEANWAFFEFGKDDPMPLVTCFEDDPKAILASHFNCRRSVFDGSFDKDSRRFEMVGHGGYISQGFWEQHRRENPQQYEGALSHGRVGDPTKPDDLFIEIGRCSPS
jgi:hypothetical protein